MKNKKTLRSALIIFALFFSAFTMTFGDVTISFDNNKKDQVLGVDTSVNSGVSVIPSTANVKELDLTSTIVSVSEKDSGSFEVNYSFSVKNNTDKKITDLEILSDFKNTFPDNDYAITKIESSNLEINEGFNGLGDTKLLNKLIELLPQNSASIFLTLEFNPGSSSGPFENKLSASGNIEGMKIQESTDSSTSNTNQNNTSKDDTTTGTGNGNTGNNNSNTQKTTPPVQIETNLGPREIKILLIDIKTGAVISEINEGDVIDFSQIEYRPFTLVVKVIDGTKGSVKFGLDDKKNYRIENALPYAIAHNSDQFFEEWRVEPGSHSVTITVYTEKGGKGQVIGEKTVNFDIVNYELIPIPDATKEKETAREIKTYDATSDSARSSFTIEKKVETEEETQDSDDSDATEVPEFEEVVEQDEQGNIVSTKTVNHEDKSSGTLEFREETGKVLSIAINNEDQIQSETVSVVNPFPETQEESGSVAGISIDNSQGRVLAATGINLSKTVMVGLILALAVVELNLIQAEKKLLKKIVK